jgi:hypothetical protein
MKGAPESAMRDNGLLKWDLGSSQLGSTFWDPRFSRSLVGALGGYQHFFRNTLPPSSGRSGIQLNRWWCHNIKDHNIHTFNHCSVE